MQFLCEFFQIVTNLKKISDIFIGEKNQHIQMDLHSSNLCWSRVNCNWNKSNIFYFKMMSERFFKIPEARFSFKIYIKHIST